MTGEHILETIENSFHFLLTNHSSVSRMANMRLESRLEAPTNN